MKLHFALLLILTLLFTACEKGDVSDMDTLAPSNPSDFDIDTLAPSSPTVTSKPTQSNQNSVTIEINGEVNSDIYVNGIKVLSIGSTGKENITLSLAGVDGIKDFSIRLKDVGGNVSEALIFSIDKDATAPSFSLSDVSVAENQRTAFTVMATDAHPLTYELAGLDKAKFDLSSTGIVSFKVPPNYEEITERSFILSITVSDSFGNEKNESLTVNVFNVAEFKPMLDAKPITVDVNTVGGTVLANRLGITITGDTAISSIVLTGDIANRFEVANNGELTLKTNATLTDVGGIHVLTAVATNAAGSSAPVDYTFNVDGIVPSIPTLTVFTANIEENASIGTTVGTVTVANAGDKDITAFTLSDNTNFLINSNGVITTNTALDFETTSSYILSVTATNSVGESASVDVNITVTDVADVIPTLTAFTANIAENVSRGTTVGIVTVANAGDTDITAFTLNDDTNFVINSSGVITTKVTLDFETTPSYSLSVTATNTAGESTSVSVNITVTDVADVRPTLTAFTANIAENVSTGTTIGTVIVANAGDTAITAYTLSDSTNFLISSSGVITTNTALDFETTSSYTLSVTATNSAGESASVNVNITVTDVADVRPTLTAFTANIAENVSTGTTIGTVIVANAGDTAITAYTLSDSTNFLISSSGVITTNTALDFETTSSYTLSVTATNSAGESASVNVIITVTDVADVRPTLTVFTANIEENASIGTTVGRVTVANAGEKDITAFTLSDSTNFLISSNGVITTNTALDFETTSSYTLSVTATNSVGKSASVNVNITVTDVADVIPTLTAFTANIAENVSRGTTVGIVTVANAGDTDITAFTLNDDTNFVINSSGLITTKVTLDFETTPSYSLSVTATNTAGESTSVSVSITVTDVADTIPTLTAFTANISEDASIGTTVGTGTVTVANAGDTAITAYTLSDSTNFLINSNGVITTNAALDFETTPSYSLSVTATNTAGESTSVSVSITVTDVADTIPTLTAFTANISEDASIGTTVETGTGTGTVTVANAGDTAITAFTLSDNTNFLINSNGVITTNAALDFETTPSYSLSVTATNTAGESTSVSVSITVTDVADTIPTLTAFTANISEDASIGTTVETGTGTGTVTVANAGDTAITAFTLSDNTNFLINSNGVITTNAALDFETTPSYSLSVTATNTAGESASVDVNITVIDIVEQTLRLLKTGQTIEYAEFDDGYYNRGLERSYARNESEEVTDNTTGLVWQDDNNTKSMTLNHADSITYCMNLTLGGFSTWRLPSIEELVYLADKGRVNPALDPVFNNVVSNTYWSSSKSVANINLMWVVQFGLGFDFAQTVTIESNVRCVRDVLISNQ